MSEAFGILPLVLAPRRAAWAGTIPTTDISYRQSGGSRAGLFQRRLVPHGQSPRIQWTAMAPEPAGQQAIWRHFQNATPEVFTAARPRLDWLLAQVQRRAAGGRPAVLNIGIGDGY